MQSIIAIEKIDKGRQTADTCVHFGFCTAVCPTYVLDGEENDSPRGRIALIKDMLTRGGKPDAATVTHVDRCLSCLSCATTCAAGVDYRTLVDTAREYIEASGARPLPQRWMRRALAGVLTNARLMRSALQATRPLAGVAKRLPGPFGALGRMARAPALEAFASREGSAVPPWPAPGLPASKRVALLEGCAQSVIGAEINESARRVLHRVGVEVVDCGTGTGCCGAMHLHMGHAQHATRQASVLVEKWGEALRAGKIDAIVVTTSGCGSVIKHYRELFQSDPGRFELAARVEEACLDISEFLKPFSLTLADSHLGARIAYHDSCSLNHGQRITREPRTLLRKAGFTVLDVAEAHLCCGSAGTYNILQPRIAERLGRRKAENIGATKPDVVTAANLGCLVQISMYLDAPVAHIVQLIDWATGGPPPRGLEAFEARASEPEPAPPATAPNAAPQPATETTDLLW